MLILVVFAILNPIIRIAAHIEVLSHAKIPILGCDEIALTK
jgi:hypothetical protein